MVITIDGPAGTGKIQRRAAVADRPSAKLLDTKGDVSSGRGWKRFDVKQILKISAAAFVATCANNFRLGTSPAGRAAERRAGWAPAQVRRVTTASYVAVVGDPPDARATAARSAKSGSLVTEGRDQGSVVFPRGREIHLDASPQGGRDAEFAASRVARSSITMRSSTALSAAIIAMPAGRSGHCPSRGRRD
jgi:cytidylate kinase